MNIPVRLLPPTASRTDVQVLPLLVNKATTMLYVGPSSVRQGVDEASANLATGSTAVD